MAHGKHRCNKSKNDPTYSAQWSGVSYAPHCPNGCKCGKCGSELHLEGHGAHYCPACDDFRPAKATCDKR